MIGTFDSRTFINPAAIESVSVVQSRSEEFKLIARTMSGEVYDIAGPTSDEATLVSLLSQIASAVAAQTRNLPGPGNPAVEP